MHQYYLDVYKHCTTESLQKDICCKKKEMQDIREVPNDGSRLKALDKKPQQRAPGQKLPDQKAPSKKAT